MPCKCPGAGVVSQHALQVSRPTPGGKLRGLAWGVSRPTPRGEVEGSGLRGVSRPTPGGGVEGSGLGGVSRPTLGGLQHALRQTPPPPADGYCCGRYASYWNAFLLLILFLLLLLPGV